ncbi:alpha/beta hydrolase [Actinoplanes sp. NPDC049265]|uniref:alpha/beta hydrolase n=1 Tax=Actinoplanes sp. NPDC049265 TaxID=3363902 RepID=UPI00371688E4
MRRTIFTAAAAVVLLGTGAPLPATAGAGPARFYAQPVAWGACPADFPDWVPGVTCAVVLVPLDYRRPDGPTETVDISRRPASDPAGRLGVFVPIPGGPGGSTFESTGYGGYEGLSTRYDVIGIAPRGVGPSQPLLCEGESVPKWGHTRMDDARMRAYAEEYRRHDQECERAGGARRPYFTTANNARDLDVVRAALGESRLNLMGHSYGTKVTAAYGTLFPGRLNRSVLDSAMHPDWTFWEAWKQQPIAQRRNTDRWMSWVAQRNRTYGLGTTRDAVHATVERLRARLEADPIGGEFDGDGLDQTVGATAAQPPDWDYLAGEIRGLVDRTGTTDLRSRRLLEDPPPTSSGVREAVQCETDWPRDLNVYYREVRYFSVHYPYGWGAANAAPLECAFGSVEQVEPPVAVRRDGYPTGLVVQEELDAQTPYQGGVAMAARLGHRLLTVPADGEHVAYGSNACVTATVDDYFLTGRLPRPGATCAGRPVSDVPPDK